MSQRMQLTVVAECVETAEQRAWVAGHGIEQYPGFLYSPPLPAGEFDTLLHRA